MEQNVLERVLEGSMKPTHLPLETLRKITDDFSEDRMIGEGGFGTVYKGVVGNKNVAVKRIRSSMTIKQKLFRREVDSLMDVNHENVVRFLGLCSHTIETPMKDPESRGYIYAEIRERLLCFEYVGNGSLDKYITDELRGLEWDTRYQIIKGICAGLHYLHMEKRILHMDLKPANILLDNQMVPKITDFGLSRPVENPQTMTTNHFSTPGYGAPENLFSRGTMSVKSDMYSLGAIIIELVTGYKGIPDNNSNILRRWRHRWNKSGKETPLEYHQQVTECIEIGSLCLNSDPYTRPSISQIMSKFVEMESTKVSPLYWEDDMLGVEPLELQFRYDKEQILSCPVELSNNTDGFIAFKIQTTSPVPYSIEPNMDIVKPRSRCSVDITLPAANTPDHRAALQYSTSNKQYTEEFIVRSIKVNEDLAAKDINQDAFDKHTSGQHVDEIHLVVVSESPTTTDIDEEPIIAVSNSGTRSTPAESGRVELAIKSNNKVPLLENNTKVMLELTGGDYTSDRPGLDLVAVLHVGPKLKSWMMDEMKTAMQFVVRKLSPIDRLSVVTFSDAATKLCCPLRQITETSRQELLEFIDGIIEVSAHATNIKDGLLTGLKVLTDRKVSAGRIAAIILMASDQKSKGNATEVSVDMVLSAVAANSMGGTFSHIQGHDVKSGGGLTKAFSQCLAGLLTVSVQDLELTVASVRDELRIVKVTAGSYPQKEDDGLVTVMFGNLYSREVRKVIVGLLLPATQSERGADILEVKYSHSREDGMDECHGDAFGWSTSDSDSIEENINLIGPHDCGTINRMFSNFGKESEAIDEYWEIVQMTFESEEQCYNFYNSYAEKKGFSVGKDIVKREKKVGDIFYRRFVCSKEGSRDPAKRDIKDRKRRERAETQEYCTAELSIRLDKDRGVWFVDNFLADHNHILTNPDETRYLRSHRKIKDYQKSEIMMYESKGIRKHQIMDVLGALMA